MLISTKNILALNITFKKNVKTFFILLFGISIVFSSSFAENLIEDKDNKEIIASEIQEASLEKEIIKPTIIEGGLEKEIIKPTIIEDKLDKVIIESEVMEDSQEKMQILNPSFNKEIQNIQNTNTISIPTPIYIIVIISLILALSAIWVSFWLYKWRKRIISDMGTKNTIIVPEDFLENQQQISKYFKELASNVATLAKNLNGDIANLDKQYNELMDNFLTLRKALDERDAEIKKLKEGYDQTIIKKSLRRFLKTHQSVSDSYKENPSDQLEQILYLFNDALEEAGVEIFSPGLNALYSKTDGLSENPKKITAPNKEDVGKIQQVNEEGYRMKIPSGYEYLIPSKVTIYIEENTEEK